VNVETQKVSDGVWYLTGGTHHSVAVEFKSYVCADRMPLNDDRAVALIEAVKKTIPNSRSDTWSIRITISIMRRPAGMRGEGATILTAAENKPYYEKCGRCAHACGRID